MPRMYAATVRRQIVARLRSGEAVAAVAAETGICQATLFRWKRQALIDAGVIEGTPSVEADELAAAHNRIAQLEAELALTRDACELFNAEAVVPPKHRRAIVEGLIARGHSARSACRITGLTRSLLQYHRRRPVPDRQIRRLIVADTITEIHQRSRGTYGGRRIRAALLADYDMNVNLKLVRSIMGEQGLHGLPHPPRRLPNLIRVTTPDDLVNRHFTATQPNELWCTDITEHPARDGKVYCCAILDCFSRMIVARTFSTTPDTALVNNAVNMAVEYRNRCGATIIHADHGSQFTSWSFGENIRRWGLLASFGTIGDCYDNAAMESFWARLQVELLNTRRWATTLELAAAMADYIDNFTTPNGATATSVTSARQSTKRSGRPPIRFLSSHDHGSKRRAQITWTNPRGLISWDRAIRTRSRCAGGRMTGRTGKRLCDAENRVIAHHPSALIPQRRKFRIHEAPRHSL